jgi:hypothetical protein
MDYKGAGEAATSPDHERIPSLQASYFLQKFRQPEKWERNFLPKHRCKNRVACNLIIILPENIKN